METLLKDYRELDVLLGLVCEQLQITPDQHSTAEEYYGEVGKWLVSPKGLLSKADPQIYPQGSFSTGTIVKPIRYQEYDLDLVCELQIEAGNYTPVQVLNAVEERLKESSRYSHIVERRDRCIRLNHEKQFHMDIIPACPIRNDSLGRVYIPDRKSNEWKNSNPKGFAEWFENRSRIIRVLNKAAGLDEMPGYESYREKSPLKLIVQLLKRNRDLYFKADPSVGPASIFLATLAGHSYSGGYSVIDGLKFLVNEVRGRILIGDEFKVENPSNPGEDLSRKFKENPRTFENFKNWLLELNEGLDELTKTYGNGIPEMSKTLNKLFGDAVIKNSLTAHANLMEKARSDQKLKVSRTAGIATSTMSISAPTIKRNNFYGD